MSEHQTPNGKVTKVNLHEDGSWTPMTNREIIAAVMADETIMGVDEDGALWADVNGVLFPATIDLDEVDVSSPIPQSATNDDYLWMIDDKGKFRSWEDDSELDYRSDFKYPFQKGYTRSDSHLADGPASWL